MTGSPTLDSQLIALSKTQATTLGEQNQLAAQITAFMKKNAAQLDGGAVTQAMSNLASASDQPALRAIVDNLLPNQPAMLVGPNLDATLVSLSEIVATTTAAHTTLSATTADFIQKVGAELGGLSIETALSNLSYNAYGAEISAIVDNLSSLQIANLGGNLLDQTMENLAGHYVFNTTSDTLTSPVSAPVIADFMKRVGTEVSGGAISQALSTLSDQGDQAGVSAVIDNLAAGQASSLAGYALDQTLENLASHYIPATGAMSGPASTGVIVDFMQKVGADVSGSAISQALSTLSYNGYSADVGAIVDNLVSGQAVSLAGNFLDQTLENMGGRFLPGSNSFTAPARTSVIADFMQNVGAEVTGTAVSNTLSTLSYLGDDACVSAIVDNLVPGQAASLAGNALDQALENMAGHDAIAGGVQIQMAPASATAIADFMKHVGAEVSGSAIDATLINLSYNKNGADISAIVDNLAAGQASSLAGTSLDQTMENLAGHYVASTNTYSAPVSAATITDFMKHVGADVSGSAISDTLSTLSYGGYQADVSAIVDNLVAGQASTLGGDALDLTLENLVSRYSPSANTVLPPASSTVIADFMQKVGAEVTGITISSALNTLAYGEYGVDISAIVDNLAAGQAGSLAGVQLDQTMENLAGHYVSSSNTYTAPVSATSIADFMKHVGVEVSGSAISDALSTMSQGGYQGDVLAIVDNLASGQASTLAGSALDQTLYNLGGSFNSSPANAATIADFMQKVGFAVSGTAVGGTLESLAQSADQTGLKAVVDNLQQGQAATIPATDLDQTIINLSLISTPTAAARTTLANTLADYMQKAGGYGDSSGWNQAITNLENAGDQVAANAIINNEPKSSSALAMDTHLAVLTQAMATAPSSTGAFSPVAVPTTTSDHMAVIAVHA